MLGYPENGPFAVAPARFGETSEVISEDSYGRGPVQRRIASLRGRGPQRQLGRPAGRRRRAGPRHGLRRDHERPPGGFAVPNEVVGAALGRTGGGGPVDTGPCTG